MGRMHAEEYAEAGRNGMFPMETILAWHLQANHYPPVSTQWIPVCVEAISLANDGLWDDVIPLKENYGFYTGTGRETITVAEVVEGLHLDSWIEYEEC